jgi:hypothetical protein
MTPSAWVMESTGLSTTTPAKRTIPSSTAATTVPGVARMSMPR